VVALVGVHLLDIIIALRAWSLEEGPLVGLGPTRWAIAHVAAVAIVLAAAWAVRALGADDDHDDALAVGLLVVGIVVGLAGPAGNLLELGWGPTGRLTVAGLGLLALVVARVMIRPRLPSPTTGQVGRVAVVGLVVVSAIGAPAPTDNTVSAASSGTILYDFEGSGYGWGTITTDAIDGSQSLNFDSGTDLSQSYTPNSFSVLIRPEAVTGSVGDIGPGEVGVGTMATLGFESGKLRVLSGDGETITDVGLSAGTVYEFRFHNFDFASNTLSVSVYQGQTEIYSDPLVNMSNDVDEINEIRGFDGNDYVIDNVAINTPAPDATTTVPINGTVTDSSGDPITDASVLAWNRDTQTAAGNTTTNATGAYNVSLPPGNYTISAVSNEHQFNSTDANVSGPTTVDFTLEPIENATDSDPEDTDGDGLDDDVDPDDDNDGIPDSADGDDDNDGVPDVAEVRVSGVVFNGSQVAIPNATIAFANDSTTVTTVETNQSGEYTARVGQSVYNVSVDAPGYLPENATIDTRAREEVELNAQLTASEPPLFGYITPAPNGTAIPFQPNRANRTLETSVGDPDGGPVTVEFYRLNRSGQYELIATNSSPNLLTYTAKTESLPGRNYWFARAIDATGATTDSRRGAWATPGQIRVVEDGNASKPIDDRTVAAQINATESAYNTTKTTTNGTIELLGAPNKTVDVRLSADGYRTRTVTLNTTARSAIVGLAAVDDTTIGDDDSRVAPGADLFGRVETDAGRGVPNTTVVVQNRSIYRVTATNATGWYGFDRLANGTYEITATPSNKTLQPTEGTVNLSGRTRLDVDIVAGRPPVVYPETARPVGPVTTDSVTFAVTVADPDFQTRRGDTLTATFRVNGQVVGTDTTDQAGTVSTTADVSGNEVLRWTVTLNDSYGRSTTTQTFVARAAGDIILKSETTGANLTSLTNASVTFYGDTSSVEKAITDERLNLSNVPQGSPTTAVFQADGYFMRSLVLSNLSAQRTAFLLPRTANASTVIFELVSYSTEYPPENTSLVIKRPLELGGETAYRTVSSGPFGATGEYGSRLESGVQYRLLVRNTDGDTRRIGTYTPVADSRQEVVISPQGRIDLDARGATVQFSPDTRIVDPQEQSFRVSFSVPGSVSIRNASVALVGPTEAVGTLDSAQLFSAGTGAVAANLSAFAGQEVLVVVSYRTSEGVTDGLVRQYRVREAFDSSNSLLAVAGGLTALLPPGSVDAFTSALALFLTVMLTGAVAVRFRPSSEVNALVATGILAAFGVAGWVGYNIVFISAVATVAFAGLRRGI
jgi:hypothetical protein